MAISVSRVEVQTRDGRVSGRLEQGIATFLGIPYAAPPFGANRFLGPQPVAPWDGVRNAVEYGPTVPKGPYLAPFDQILPEPVIPGDDCLNLNVWTPDPGARGLPVMVWIHGGAFANGSGAVPTYEGTAFARDGIVCVTINYRLGADGFAYFGDGTANRGLLDQVAALEWVQANIAGFGGDPANVTIFGESAGAMSVTTLLSIPRAKGLFRRVIAQSGAGSHVTSAATALRVGRELATKLGVEPSLAGLGSVSIDRLVAAQGEIAQEIITMPDPARFGELVVNLMPFEPVVDGDVLPDVPVRSIAAGGGGDTDLLIGTNSDEWRFFIVPSGLIDFVTDDLLTMATAAYGLGAGAVDVYRRARPGASAGDILGAVVTDWFFRVPAVRVAEGHAAGLGTNHVYEFAWPTPAYGGRMGACHALEVPFPFGILGRPGDEALLGANPPAELARTMHRAWIDFATTGDPGWPRYEAASRAVMRFDAHSEVVHDPRPEELQVWQGIR